MFHGQDLLSARVMYLAIKILKSHDFVLSCLRDFVFGVKLNISYSTLEICLKSSLFLKMFKKKSLYHHLWKGNADIANRIYETKVTLIKWSLCHCIISICQLSCRHFYPSNNNRDFLKTILKA